MHLVNMRPEQLQAAIRGEVPVLIAAGVIEYHGPHLPIGTDILMTERLCEEIHARCECVIAPSFPFGPTMNFAGGPFDGDMDFAPEPLFQYVKETLKGILSLGFRRIYIIHHHAGPEGLQALILKRAAAELMRELGKSWGPGWGRKGTEELPNPLIFQQVKVAGLDEFSSYESESSERMPIGHASKGETQYMMAAYPATVRMDLLEEWREAKPSWLEDSHLATADEGAYWLEFCVQGWVKELTKP
jgi:creatinine amidohydrolase